MVCLPDFSFEVVAGCGVAEGEEDGEEEDNTCEHAVPGKELKCNCIIDGMNKFWNRKLKNHR